MELLCLLPKSYFHFLSYYTETQGISSSMYNGSGDCSSCHCLTIGHICGNFWLSFNSLRKLTLFLKLFKNCFFYESSIQPAVFPAKKSLSSTTNHKKNKMLLKLSR